MARRRRLLPDLDRSGGFVAMAGLVCVLFLFLGSAGFLPWYVTVLLVALWVALLVQAARWFTTAPARSVLLPVLGLAVWVGVVWLAAR